MFRNSLQPKVLICAYKVVFYQLVGNCSSFFPARFTPYHLLRWGFHLELLDSSPSLVS